MHGVEVYRMYLAMKQHFSNRDFEYFSCGGRVRCGEEKYLQSRGYWFCETIGRKHSEKEVEEILLSVFLNKGKKTWVKDIQREGEGLWKEHQRRLQSLSYTFESEFEPIVEKYKDINNILHPTERGHPPLLIEHIKGRVSLETMCILQVVFGYRKYWDKVLSDILWEEKSFQLSKYLPFLSINRQKYCNLISKTIQENT